MGSKWVTTNTEIMRDWLLCGIEQDSKYSQRDQGLFDQELPKKTDTCHLITLTQQGGARGF